MFLALDGVRSLWWIGGLFQWFDQGASLAVGTVPYGFLWILAVWVLLSSGEVFLCKGAWGFLCVGGEDFFL